jgi:hypothetical protein
VFTILGVCNCLYIIFYLQLYNKEVYIVSLKMEEELGGFPDQQFDGFEES